MRLCMWIAGPSVLVLAVAARADDGAKPDAAMAAAKGLDFLVQDAAKWKKDRQCATCHHGTMTVWALCEAKRQGIAVDADNFAATVSWTKERLKDIDKARDSRPGWNMVSTPAVYLSVMALSIPKQEAITADELKRIAGHLVRHQEADGSWAWSLAPATNRPAPFFESDEVVTMLAEMALASQVPAKSGEKSEIRMSRDEGTAWLAKAKPTDTTQAAVLHLYRDFRLGKPPSELKKVADALIARQNPDCGWGQRKSEPSDAYATGQILYFLSLAGIEGNRAEIRKGVDYLVSSQKADGSWPMKSRMGKNLVPITYFGSAWATLALLRNR